MKDIFIACHDNLTGLCDAINSIFPKTKNQLCIVHQIRNSCKFVPYKDGKAVCADLKKIYGAVNLDDAEFAKEEFREKWDKKYPNILKSWDKNWSELTVFFEYPQEIRKIIYCRKLSQNGKKIHQIQGDFPYRRRYPQSNLYVRGGDFQKVDYAGSRLGTGVLSVCDLFWGQICGITAFEGSVPPSSTRGLPASEISGEKEKRQHFCYRFPPFYLTACVGRSSALLCSAVNLVLSEFWVLNGFTQFIFQNLGLCPNPRFFAFVFKWWKRRCRLSGHHLITCEPHRALWSLLSVALSSMWVKHLHFSIQ